MAGFAAIDETVLLPVRGCWYAAIALVRRVACDRRVAQPKFHLFYARAAWTFATRDILCVGARLVVVDMDLGFAFLWASC